jgi:hypothetical protein
MSTTRTRPRSTYPRAGEVRFVDAPTRRYFMVDGTGVPEGSDTFKEAMGALYGLAYTLHFDLKRRGIEAGVGAIEGLWASGPGDVLRLDEGDRDEWRWTLLLPVPDEATDDDIAAATAELRRKKNPPALDRVRVEELAEGKSAEILHIGPYEAERPTIERLHAAIADAGLRPRGRHHEIYLGDPRRTAPEMLKTVIRQPVE